ncbi:MAG: fused DSP-PTPase phosphatase/NAD kinase-like protein [Candidatus Sumerlaeaceae bacterium]
MLNNFGYLLEGEMAGCGHPDSYGDCGEALAELRDRGTEALVSLDEDGVPLHLVAEHGLHYLHLPIPDFHPPTLKQAEEFVEFAKMQRAEGRQITVHCRGGYGRTGTMLACYLIASGKTAEEAINLVRAARPGSIETRGQERFVRDFENYLRATDRTLDRRKASRKKRA